MDLGAAPSSQRLGPQQTHTYWLSLDPNPPERSQVTGSLATVTHATVELHFGFLSFPMPQATYSLRNLGEAILLVD